MVFAELVLNRFVIGMVTEAWRGVLVAIWEHVECCVVSP